MIRVVCPNCKSTLDAKDRLAGQTRKCPKCSQPVLIPEVESPSAPLVEAPIAASGRASARQVEIPKRLRRANRYLIYDTGKLIAAWKDDGRGWMLKTTAGMISALRNRDQIPEQGNFMLVELKLTEGDGGRHLDGITVYQLSGRALTMIDRDESKILSGVAGPGFLGRHQKNLIRQTIRDELMYDVWKDASSVLEYLGNTDYHSAGTE